MAVPFGLPVCAWRLSCLTCGDGSTVPLVCSLNAARGRTTNFSWSATTEPIRNLSAYHGRCTNNALGPNYCSIENRHVLAQSAFCPDSNGAFGNAHLSPNCKIVRITAVLRSALTLNLDEATANFAATADRDHVFDDIGALGNDGCFRANIAVGPNAE